MKAVQKRIIHVEKRDYIKSCPRCIKTIITLSKMYIVQRSMDFGCDYLYTCLYGCDLSKSSPFIR